MSSKYSPKLVKELEDLLNQALDTSDFPYVRGKSIRIKHLIVRGAKFGYLVFDTKENKEVAKMFCKTSALALAKTVAKSRNLEYTNKIKKLDFDIQKHYNDALFYKNTIRITKDKVRRDVAQMRYEISADRTRRAKQELDTFIYY